MHCLSPVAGLEKNRILKEKPASFQPFKLTY